MCVGARARQVQATKAEVLATGGLPRAATTVLVDGNNVRGGGAQRLSRRGLWLAARSLAARSARAARPVRLVLFFDGGSDAEDAADGAEAGAGAGLEPGPGAGAVEVVHCHQELADDVIVRHIEALPSWAAGDVATGGGGQSAEAGSVLVVTSDRGLVLRCLGLGACVLKCGPFLRLAQAAHAQAAEEAVVL
jgi:hypothetical protein